MAIFNSKLLVYQRVTDMKILEPGEHACADEPSVVALPLPDGVLRTGSMALWDGLGRPWAPPRVETTCLA